MRTRFAVLLALVATVVAMTALMPAAHASTNLVLAQDTTDEGEPLVGEEDATEGQETGDESDTGSSEEEAETGSGEEGTGEAAAETGPLWTYQMAKIVIALLVLMALAIAGAYYNFVHKRQRQGL